MDMMAADLTAFVEEIDGDGVIWGETDCTATPASWLKRRGFAFDLPAYRSREEAHAIIARHGSLVATWDHYLGGCIDERFGDPQTGDVAVIDTRLYRQIGGIVAVGNLLIVRRDDGRFSWFPARRYAKVWAAS